MAQTTKPSKSVSPKKETEIPVLFNLPVEMPSVYATNIVVQMTDFEVVLSFYETQPPLDTDSLKTPDAETLQRTGVRADCVARVTVARGRFEGFANVISGILKMSKDAERLKGKNVNDSRNRRTAS